MADKTFTITLHYEVSITAKESDAALRTFVNDIPLDLSPYIAIKEEEDKEEPRYYGEVAWSPEDVASIRPDWPIEKCKEALERIEDSLRDGLTEIGWEVMATLLKEG